MYLKEIGSEGAKSHVEMGQVPVQGRKILAPAQNERKLDSKS